MILYYALGDGLGHLSRARRIIPLLPYRDEVFVVTNSTFAEQWSKQTSYPVVSPTVPVRPHCKDYHNWWRDLLARLRPQTMIVDTFPLGLVGELGSLLTSQQLSIHYLARLLQWDKYRNSFRAHLPKIEVITLLETLQPNHAHALQGLAEPYPLTLHPEQDSASDLERLFSHLSAKVEKAIEHDRLWIIVHSGPKDEVDTLIAYAKEMARIENLEPFFLLISPRDLQLDIPTISLYPAWPVFAHANRIISGCGFNIMSELSHKKHHHYYLPFPRVFDDQFTRAERARGDFQIRTGSKFERGPNSNGVPN